MNTTNNASQATIEHLIDGIRDQIAILRALNGAIKNALLVVVSEMPGNRGIMSRQQGLLPPPPDAVFRAKLADCEALTSQLTRVEGLIDKPACQQEVGTLMATADDLLKVFEKLTLAFMAGDNLRRSQILFRRLREKESGKVPLPMD